MTADPTRTPSTSLMPTVNFEGEKLSTLTSKDVLPWVGGVPAVTFAGAAAGAVSKIVPDFGNCPSDSGALGTPATPRASSKIVPDFGSCPRASRGDFGVLAILSLISPAKLPSASTSAAALVPAPSATSPAP